MPLHDILFEPFTLAWHITAFFVVYSYYVTAVLVAYACMEAARGLISMALDFLFDRDDVKFYSLLSHVQEILTDKFPEGRSGDDEAFFSVGLPLFCAFMIGVVTIPGLVALAIFVTIGYFARTAIRHVLKSRQATNSAMKKLGNKKRESDASRKFKDIARIEVW